MRDFDNDMDEITKQAFRTMYKGLGLLTIIVLTALLILGVCYK